MRFGRSKPKPARLGYFAPAPNAELLAALYSGLRDFGWIEGQNLAIDQRYLRGQPKTYDEIAAELVRLNPDVIVVVGTPPALALMRKTAADPPRTGLVASLSPRVGCACIVIATSSRTAPISGASQRRGSAPRRHCP